MAKPYFRRLFGRVPAPALETTEAKADRGDADAQFHLGLHSANGESERHDYAVAARWYLKAAEQNHAPAQLNLGMLYAQGHGVPQDEAQAERWIQAAAQQGNAAAQFHLGMRHYRAVVQARQRNFSESRIEAYKWLRLAAAQGYQHAESVCEQVTLSMTGDEVTDGNQRLAGFAAEHPVSPSPP